MKIRRGEDIEGKALKMANCVCTLFIICSLCIGFSSGQKVEILDDNGVRIVKNAKDPVPIDGINVQPYSSVIDSRGNFYAFALEFADTVSIKLLKFDQEFSAVSTISSLEMPKENEIPPPELMEQFYFQIGENDSLIWGKNYKYELNFTDKAGKLFKKISREATPEKVTRALLVREVKKRYPFRPVPDSMKIPDFYPKKFPFFNSILCDDEGRVFVRTLENYGSGICRYDVFNAEGIYIACFECPENEEIVAIRKAKVYSRIRENEEGIPVIKRYRIEWKQ
jgi:hypothetical protein